jgi:uncharacterized NAD(P)/FAD-binding protein YdhS
MANQTVAVIGAGFSGTLLSLHLQDRSPPGTRIVLIERDGQFGPGLAYSTANPNHLLNVPAGRMSAFEHRPRDFLDWLEGQPALVLDGVELAVSSFIPRRLYGAYLRHLLTAALRRQTPNTLELVHDSVTAIESTRHQLILRHASGRSLTADRVVIATGNQQPEPIPVNDSSFYSSSFWRADALATNAFTGLSPTAPVLLIGTGLTTVDAVISLLDQGHTGEIHALSRRGLLPRSHASVPAATRNEPPAYPGDIRQLTRLVRQQAEHALAAGDAWQPVIDALRPFTQDIWQTMTPCHRERFLRHLRPWWDVHRHRMPQPIAARIDAAQSSGQLRIHGGRVMTYNLVDRMVAVHFRPRGSEQAAELRVARVVNCSGPATDYERIADPLVQDLLSTGLARPDACRLGLDVTATCALNNRTGTPSEHLFAIGPLTRGTFWEITAVPDIRRQCATLATHLAGLPHRQIHRPPRSLHYAA